MDDFNPEGGVFEIGNPLASRFPENYFGFKVIREMTHIDEGSLTKALNALTKLHSTTPARRGLIKPRVFISHRWNDERLARKIAFLATIKGFNFWLDAMNAKLQSVTKAPHPNPKQQALIVAILIEMALLNCTHVLAVVTRRTAGSLWVPYEYGRVKGTTMFSSVAATWMSRRLRGAFGEYLFLGPIHSTRIEIDGWMQSELSRWGGPKAARWTGRRTP